MKYALKDPQTEFKKINYKIYLTSEVIIHLS